MLAKYPQPEERFDNEEVADEMAVVIEVITALRNIRGEMNIPPGEQIVCMLRTKNERAEERLRRNRSFVENLARVKEVRFGDSHEKPVYSAFAVVRDVEIRVPMERSRVEEEGKRLQKELAKIEKDIAFVEKKLSNEQFLARAPADGG